MISFDLILINSFHLVNILLCSKKHSSVNFLLEFSATKMRIMNTAAEIHLLSLDLRPVALSLKIPGVV